MRNTLALLFCVILTACGGGGGSAGPTGTSANVTAIAGLAKVTDVGAAPNTVYNTAVGDLNGDNLDDVVISGWNFDGTPARIWVFVQNANGTLTDRSDLLPVNTVPGSQHVFVADFDNDGRNDIFVPGFKDGWAMDSANSVMFWNNGTFTRDVFADRVMAHGACIDDIDNDGDMDMLVSGNQGASILYVNNGNRNFTADLWKFGGQWFATCAITHQPNGDVNVVMGNNRSVAGYSSVVAVYNSALRFLYSTGIGTLGMDLINSAAIDMNGDGHKDFVLAYSNLFPLLPSREVLLNTGLNTYAAGMQLDSLGSDYYSSVLTLNGNPAVFLPADSGKSRLYTVVNGIPTAYHAPAFGAMSGSHQAQASTVYQNANTGKVFMLQLIDDAFYTQEM
jgi:hypothetical protein